MDAGYLVDGVQRKIIYSADAVKVIFFAPLCVFLKPAKYLSEIISHFAWCNGKVFGYQPLEKIRYFLLIDDIKRINRQIELRISVTTHSSFI